MSKASVKKGYARLANELAREFARRDFNETQYAILFATVPETYGYKGRESFPYARAAMAQATGRDVSHVGRAVTALVDAGVLLLNEGWLGINPRIDEWQIAIKKGAENALSGGRKTPEATGVKRPESGRKTPEKRAENARPASLKSADIANLAEPKEKKESKETFPLKGVSQEGGQAIASKVSGLVAMAQEAEWFEGEQERFFELTPYRRIRDFGMAQGTTAELIKTYLSFSKESRQALWLYADQRKAATATSKPESFTLAWAVKYLQDPASYPAINRKDSFLAAVDLKAAEPTPGNPWKDRPYWRLYDPRFVDVVREDEEGQVRYLVNTVGTRHGVDTFHGLNGIHRTKGIDAVMRHIDYLWDKQPARKEAANG